ncbi:MAG TPA: beta-galactosidase GalB [Pyrinomonadaceae bacterium]|nr:beta-galactosidase GalB [Pyrinomonadaceae bacterium]
MNRLLNLLVLCLLCLFVAQTSDARTRVSFNTDWQFHLGETTDNAKWRQLNLPHDWSIEGEFSEKHPAGTGGGALPGGIGWYRKTFTVPTTSSGKQVFVEFDGVYRNSEVWINGHYLGKRPYGYSSFAYELTPHLVFGGKPNVIEVKVDNSQQPNSRWYSGSGIYRNVWLTTVERVHVAHWGTYWTTPEVNTQAATVVLNTKVTNSSKSTAPVNLTTIIQDANGREVARETQKAVSQPEVSQTLKVASPVLWSDERPYLYKIVTQLEQGGRIVDRYETPLGIRTFRFDVDKGFILNGKPVKIRGVCNHHDLGSLGAAVNTRAIERQLEMLKAMGVNGIRTSHNPPAPELLELTDRLGFIVMDEAFDVWKKEKTKYDYHLDWDEWHKRDLEDMVLRDRNHPSIFIWSIGNEVAEQWNNSPDAGRISKQLVAIVRNLDKTRPITAAANSVNVQNTLLSDGDLDLVGTNYDHNKIPQLQKMFPGRPIIGTETTSALATRGVYDMPSDQIRRWPRKWDEVFKDGNPDFTVSAYDNVSAPWGSTHEESWKIIKKHDFFSGMYIWTGWDYIGEPTPYPWPSVTSYFGIIDLAGFPKDTFYMYQSEWTTKPVLHIFPHWNWKQGEKVDVVAYFNADEVELFLNGRSQGTKRKEGDQMQVFWRLPYEPGVLKAVSRKNGQVVLTKEIRTAGAPARIELIPDRKTIKADGGDLSFVTVKVVDRNGTLVPFADNLIKFELTGEASIAGVDNGYQASHESFKGKQRKAWKGMALAIVQSKHIPLKQRPGRIVLKATSDNLPPASVVIDAR